MLCPRCRQPIDGPEEYICCGTEALEWRCRACGKVSEGFAFPYGRCPACNGALESRVPPELADDAAIGAVRTAFEIELGGQAFYSQAAREAADDALRDLFARLAAMEAEHIDTLARRYRTALPGPGSAGPSGVARAALFAGVARRPGDPVDLLGLAIACETRAAGFFDEKSREMPPDSFTHQLYRELAAEEREHADLLTTERDRRRAGQAGLL